MLDFLNRLHKNPPILNLTKIHAVGAMIHVERFLDGHI
jgi:hypothetical protein